MDNIYFANKEAKDTCSILLAKAEHWQQGIKSNGLLDKMRNMWRAYHGAYYSAVGDGHEVSFSGEQGELTNLPVNHFRNIASHMLNMTTANRPSLEARATSTDYKSLVQTTLANNILEYYLREKRLETVFKRATEYAIVFGSGFIKMEWNATAGDIYDVIEENGQEIPLYNGDIEFETISPFDVLVDTSKDTWKMDWVVVRTWKNKYDLAAKYPEYADQIVGLKTKSEEESMIWGTFNLHEQTDDIAVYEFFHRRTDAVSNGRYILFLTNEIILQDRNLPYRIVPVFRISAGEILGTPHGYSPLYDILPIQEAINTLYSTVLTNQSTFGVQNIWIKRGADISVNNLQGGLNVIESLEKPEPINLTQTPKEIFTFIEMLERVAETLSGVNSVTRGNPEASLKSGAALALVQSMALQFMSGLQQSYVQIVEDVGTAVIKFLQDFAESPRLIAIAGKDNRSRMKEFINDDIENISRVVVDMGNPLARTTAGRVQIADNLLQYQLLKSPQQYINVLNTGRLDILTDDIQHELLLIQAENEKIIEGEVPIVTVIDDHQQHIIDHRKVLADPDLRKDPLLVGRAVAHIQEHINQLRTADPDLLVLLKQQPLQPKPTEGMPSPEAVMQPPNQGLIGANVNNEEVQMPGMAEATNLPNMPTVPADALPNPEIQEQQMGNVR